MIALLLTPIGRYALIAGLIIMLVSLGIHKIKQEAIAEMELQATQESIRRTNEAISAGDHVDVDAGRLRERDKFERD